MAFNVGSCKNISNQLQLYENSYTSQNVVNVSIAVFHKINITVCISCLG